MTNMIVKNDPSDPFAKQFSSDDLIWGHNINQGQDFQADWGLPTVRISWFHFSLTTAPPAVK